MTSPVRRRGLNEAIYLEGRTPVRVSYNRDRLTAVSERAREIHKSCRVPGKEFEARNVREKEMIGTGHILFQVVTVFVRPHSVGKFVRSHKQRQAAAAEQVEISDDSPIHAV